jgi:hypothetical protein
MHRPKDTLRSVLASLALAANGCVIAHDVPQGDGAPGQEAAAVEVVESEAGDGAQDRSAPDTPDGGGVFDAADVGLDVACPASTALCSGVCTDTTLDSANCGRCGVACTGGTLCRGGGCACSPGTTSCGGTCRDTNSDPANCGGCGQACPPGLACAAGVCNCPPGQTACGGACRDLSSDVSNCDACGHACSAAHAVNTCALRACMFVCDVGFADCDAAPDNGCEADLNTDNANCGTCGHACTGARTCVAGGCTPH